MRGVDRVACTTAQAGDSASFSFGSQLVTCCVENTSTSTSLQYIADFSCYLASGGTRGWWWDELSDAVVASEKGSTSPNAQAKHVSPRQGWLKLTPRGQARVHGTPLALRIG